MKIANSTSQMQSGYIHVSLFSLTVGKYVMVQESYKCVHKDTSQSVSLIKSIVSSHVEDWHDDPKSSTF